MKIVGIDNGVTGSITIIDTKFGNANYHKTPVFKSLNYTKKKGWITRIDTDKLRDILFSVPREIGDGDTCMIAKAMILIERPMVNPKRFKATVSALRALEATLTVIEKLEIPYRYIDSKEWQKEMLPSGLKGSAELKTAARDVGKRVFPYIKLEKKDDADSLLIAEYGRRTYGDHE